MAQEFKSKELDSELYKIVTTFYNYAIAKNVKIEIEEEARNAKFITYRVSNPAAGLSGHIGRHVRSHRQRKLTICLRKRKCAQCKWDQKPTAVE
jgi:hypothetical protein